VLTASDVARFEDDGFIVVRRAFPASVAAECRAILWEQTGCAPRDRNTWTRPVIRLGDQAGSPFRAAVNTPVLHDAFDTLVGRGRWTPRESLGTFPIRFPSTEDPGDAGWHVDAGFYAADGSMRCTVDSRGRALLMLFLFSDTGPDDAPTRILVGSHLDMPRLLEPAGDAGLSFLDLAARFPASTLARPLAHATGRAGDVFLCHPFLVHAAQSHHGNRPRFLAQPPLHPSAPLQLERADSDYSPVERAIRRGLGLPR
jgi:hypothetical protein